MKLLLKHIIIILFFIASSIYAEEEILDINNDNELSVLGYGKCEYLIAGLHVNYIKSNIISTIISCKNKNTLVLFDDLKEWNIKYEYFTNSIVKFDNQEYVNLKTLDKSSYKIDIYNLVLDLKLPAEAMQLQKINGSETKKSKRKISGKPISAISLKYDYSLLSDNKSKILTGNHELAYFTKGNGVFVNKFLLQKDMNYSADKSKILRSETYWNFDFKDDVASLRIGDNNTKSADWSSSTSFAGIQYATNFALQPNFIRNSLMSFSHTSEAPGTLEIYANAHPVLKRQIDTGDFSVEDLQVPIGSNELVVETTDVTGRKNRIVIPYYIPPSLLKPGLSEYSFSFGLQRHNQSSKSNIYRNLIASMNYELGVNNYLTMAGYFDILYSKKHGTKASLGVTNKISLHDYGFITLSCGTNIHKTKQAQKIMASYVYSNEDFSAGISYSMQGRNFENSLIEESTESESSNSFSAHVGYGNNDLGRLSLVYVSNNSKSSKDKRVRLNYSKSFNNNQNVLISYDQNLIDKKDKNISLSYSMNLRVNDAYSVGANMSRTNKGKFQQNINFIADNMQKSRYRYGGQLSHDGSETKYKFNFKKDTDHATLEFNTNGNQDGNASYRYGLSGGLVFMDKQLFLTSPVKSSIALVKVDGYEDFPIYYNNNLATHTNKRGSAVLTNLAANSVSKVSIKGSQLKMNTHLSSPELYVSPGWKTATLLEFALEEHKVLIGELVYKSGKRLEENHQLVIDGIDKDMFSGYYGQVYMETVPKLLEKFEGTACKRNKCCSFSVSIPKDEDEIMYDLGEILCTPIAQDDDEKAEDDSSQEQKEE